MSRILLHCCCGPCAMYPIKDLLTNYYDKDEVTLFWYNPNIHPYTEYKARRDCLSDYTKQVGVNLIIKDNYGLDEFCKNIINDLGRKDSRLLHS